MNLIDTVVLVGFLNPRDRLHSRSVDHLQKISTNDDFFVPVSTLIETDLLLKISGYNDSERNISWQAIETQIALSKVIPNSPPSIRRALDLQENGMDYFDSLIASLAKETGSTVITTDKRIGEIVEADW